MRCFASLLAFAAYVAAQADPSINIPAVVVQCQPARITWIASHTPIFVTIIPGGQSGVTVLYDFGPQSGTSLTWTVNIAAGTLITFQIRDSQGAVAYSAPLIIQSSSDSSCLRQNPSGSGSPTATSPGPSSTQPATSVSTRADSAAMPSASESPNAARNNARVGLAGLLGLAAAIVMA